MVDESNKHRVAVFRFDASRSIGGGHALRCMTLADALFKKGWSCCYCVGEETLKVVPRLKERQNECLELTGEPERQPELMRKWLSGEVCDLLVVDHYGLDVRFETLCRDFASRILIIDDLANRPHDGDFVLDQTLGRLEQQYSNLVPSTCRFFLGPEFALLNLRYAARRKQSIERRNQIRSVSRILISIGLTDPLGLSGQVLEQIADIPDVEVDIVLGADAPGLDAVREKAKSYDGRVRVHVDIDDLSGLMVEADLSVGGCGSTSWERCCLGLPTLGIVIAENQQLIADNLVSVGALEVVSDMARFGEQLGSLVGDLDRMKRMSRAAASVCDGLGSERVANGLSR